MESLPYLLSTYFHQDWDSDGGRSSDTVAVFLQERPEVTAACADEIDLLLSEDLPEGALQRRLDEWGPDYWAGERDDDYRRWLMEVRDQIRAGTA
ncbi:contact-dependent growth inhibition system immunity protein [Nocardioides renjunii]|uniref:contact-dependent growth inhibition system immunity protein n=1 Tax=Nocardioides renjunii TaxID=3095075 RepID=UPI002AFF81E1|nr:contact-dependent growth inhibition system immunity protein [Nocardioides sp. S-34]WQQ21640.1 contact-dependent growth inhibition system immunity protein [Nocardioides sp. S-34]